MRRAGALAFFAVNIATGLVFNVPAVFEIARPALPELQVGWLDGGPRLSLLDNLRMEQHREQAAWLRTIDQNVEARPLSLEALGRVTDFGNRVFRVEPAAMRPSN